MEANIGFLESSFRSYYRDLEPEVPQRFGRREWGFIFFDRGMMVRHRSFSKVDEVKDFMAKRTPAHAYYSTAYYKDPGVPEMGKKGWLGADLIFDLDSDHLKGVEEMTYNQMLDRVKMEMIKLLNEFILKDLAIDERYVHLAFSGGRGYHLHVTDPTVFKLSSRERREIVDYITGRGIEVSTFVLKKGIGTKGHGRYRRTDYAWKIPAIDEGGWRSRLTKGLIEILEEISKMNEEDAIGYLTQWEGVGEKTAKEILRSFESHKTYTWKEKLEKGVVDIFPDKFPLDNFIDQSVHAGIELVEGETDEPVTTDVKRLIRLPSSLHGKTGLKVVGLTPDTVRTFEPLTDALVFGEDKIEVETIAPVDITIGGNRYELDEGKHIVPKYLAVFLVGQRKGWYEREVN